MSRRHRHKLVAGYTLVEALVAMSIAAFLLAGLGAILQATRRTSANQIGLIALQNGERLAVTMLTDVIQQAGYYPNVSNSLQVAFPEAAAVASAPAPALQAGQFVSGTSDATVNGDSITIRYQTDTTVLNCLGQSGIATPTTHEFTFSVNASKQLVCAVDGNAPVTIAGNVQNLTVLYGVDATSVTPFAGAVNAYVPASGMSAVNWTNVCSVKLVITFVNPLSDQPGQANAPPITVARVIGIMGRTGVDVVRGGA